MEKIKSLLLYRLNSNAIELLSLTDNKEFFRNIDNYIIRLVVSLKRLEDENIITILSNDFKIYEIEEFIEYLRNTDKKIICEELLSKSKFYCISELFNLDESILDFHRNKTLFSNLLISNDERYDSYLFDIGINVEYLFDNYFIVDITSCALLGFGALGIALYKNDTVTKLTISDSEIAFAQSLKENEFSEITKYFSKVNYVKYFGNNNLFGLINKDYVDGDKFTYNDEIFNSEEYKNFDNTLKNNNLYLDIHNGNGVKNPSNSNVPFMYFDY